jgi:2-keto-4-pentenoate hydratase/2-oxohepta-3-ene-1,7-dioic acid hydratase in catechol pathway
MRIARARIDDSGQVVYGRVDGDIFQPLTGSPFEREVDSLEAVGDALPLAAVKLLAPCQPGKILAIGRNYAEHAAEHGVAVPTEPLLFLKPPSAVIGPGDAIILPALSQRVEHESELVVVIGRRARHLQAAEALRCVLGYTCGNDVTARDLQRRDGQWSRAKGFDTFCPLGPWIETDMDPTDQWVRCKVNGQPRQEGHTRELVFGIDQLLAYASAVMTLEPGDILMTGTPAGVGPLAHGDSVEVSVSGIGQLVNPVRGADR